MFCLAGAPAGEPAAEQSSAQLYSEGQRAFIGGDIAGAKRMFQRVLELVPGHLGARNYLATIAERERREGTGESAAITQLRALILPSVDFRQVSLSSAIEFLRQEAAKASEGRVKPNLILKYPPGQADSIPVTISLSGIPFLEALRYVCEVAGATCTAERFGLIIAPKQPKAPGETP